MKHTAKQSKESNDASSREASKEKWTIKAEPSVSFFVKLSENLLDPKNHDLLEVGLQGRDAGQGLASGIAQVNEDLPW